MLPISKTDRLFSYVLLAGFIALVYRRVKRLEQIDQSLDQKMLRFVMAGEAGKELIARSEGWIRRSS